MMINVQKSKPSITESQIKADLEKMGIQKGDHVAVALSFKSVGPTECGPNGFIDALLEVVGPMGTVLMNTHTISFPISEIDSDFVFNPETTVPLTGLIPRTLMQRTDAIRSRHPTCSVVAVGKLAKYLTEDHDEYSEPYLPLNKLAKIGGKCLFIGTNGRLVAFRHEAQRRAGLFIVPKFTGVKFKNLENETKGFVWIFPPCAKKLPEIVPNLFRMGVIVQGKVGLANTISSSASELIEAMTTMLKEDPTLTLCDDAMCVDCREIERRLNLLKKIPKPLFFQRNRLAVLLLQFRNRLFLYRYRYVGYHKKSQMKLIGFLDVNICIIINSMSKALKKLRGTNIK